MRITILLSLFLSLVSAGAVGLNPKAAVDRTSDGNRLRYIDANDLYYPRRGFARLVTPQWIGEDSVDAAVILAIDDMRDPRKYEAFLRPILNRLKRIDGRAAVSIMSCSVDPKDSQLQTWLNEGLSLETHTFDHPCPLLQKEDFAKAKETHEKCVDLLAAVPNSKPVAFRMPCCDSMNTPSPRFYAHVFNNRTPKGNFLTADSSVFNIFTSSDPELPRDLVIDADGHDRFRKYVPVDRAFVNTIDDYPFPYVIGRLCWQLPCVTPSDWQAQHLHKAKNPITVRDWKCALDCAVIKRGVFCLVFHPHGWIEPEQVIELIDYAVTKYGKRVKFLTFREAQERLNRNLLMGQPLRGPQTGDDNGIRLLDVDNDGFMDVVIGNDQIKRTRIWMPSESRWRQTDFPVCLTQSPGCFGIIEGKPAFLALDEKVRGAWCFDQGAWQPHEALANFDTFGFRLHTHRAGKDQGVRFVDFRGDGTCELVTPGKTQPGILVWSGSWGIAPWVVPVPVVNREGKDNGVRFVDVNGDGHLDMVWSNEGGYGIRLFTPNDPIGFRKIMEGKPGDKGALPLIARNGQDMGAWFHSRQIWWQNEYTSFLPNVVDHRAFVDLLKDDPPAAKTPGAALASIQARPGFTVELMAAEPCVEDPISFAWGPDGKLWVVEMGDYPLGVDGKGRPGGKIKRLESTKSDGVYDKATIFLENLSLPTAVMPWRAGVIIIAAPDIFYAEDTTGSGKANKKEVLISGFHQGNPQHLVNTLAWGLDNWIYCANGDSGGQIKSLKTGQTLDLRGRDFRFRPDTGEIDLQMGQTQYGRTRDDRGNWFGNHNSNPMWHFALEDHYLRRNPNVTYPDVRVNVSTIPGAAPVFPISRTVERFNDFHTANHFTSACCAIVYRDELFGPHFANNTFVCEPVHNLVHREIMTAKGTTFTSRRAADEQKSEFLASADNWFRPVWLQTGPDGALWIADMYRMVIEHPEWIPKQTQMKLDLRAGHDMGRIYRVHPVGVKPRSIPCLDRMSSAELVAALDSPNGWQRDTAQQMLIWKNDRTVVPRLEEVVANSKLPLARLHALCTLDGMEALTAGVLAKTLADKDPGVRRHAVRLCTPQRFPESRLDALTRLTDDPEPHVRLQLAYTLGEHRAAPASQALGKLLDRDVADSFIVAAAMSSINTNNLAVVTETVVTLSASKEPSAIVIENFLRMATVLQGQEKPLAMLLTAISTPRNGRYAAWQFSALAGLLDALDARGASFWEIRQHEKLRESVNRLTALFDAARTTVRDLKADTDQRVLTCRLLGRGPERQADDVPLLAGLLNPRNPDTLQAAAVAALGRMREPRVWDALLLGWKAHGPSLRHQILEALFHRKESVVSVLDAMEARRLPPSDIDATRRQGLVHHSDPAIRARAAKLFAGGIASDRQKLVESYQATLRLSGDPARGSQVFKKNCAGCHKLGDVGHVVGPDLASVGDKSPEGLLVAVLDPNRVIETRYINYTAGMKNGQLFSGVLSAESGSSITLLAQEGKQHVLLRSDIEELVSEGRSPMPEGIEKEIDHQSMADLIAFIRGQIPLPKRKEFAGNNPHLIKPDADGSLSLTSKNCEIYGRTLELEAKHGNLGCWYSEDDRAVWAVDVTKPGKYSVRLDWACAKSSAGKPFLLEAGANQLRGIVRSTGDWDTYQQAHIGEIVLVAGQQRVVLHSDGHLASPLIDLKSIKLLPARE